LQEEDLSVFNDLMSVNYLGCVYPTYYALPYLRKSKGIILVNSSLAGTTARVRVRDATRASTYEAAAA